MAKVFKFKLNDCVWYEILYIFGMLKNRVFNFCVGMRFFNYGKRE